MPRYCRGRRGSVVHPLGIGLIIDFPHNKGIICVWNTLWNNYVSSNISACLVYRKFPCNRND